jgi:hypothetical protein
MDKKYRLARRENKSEKKKKKKKNRKEKERNNECIETDKNKTRKIDNDISDDREERNVTEQNNNV